MVDWVGIKRKWDDGDMGFERLWIGYLADLGLVIDRFRILRFKV